MKPDSTLAALFIFISLQLPLHAAEMVVNEAGVHGYEDTPRLPWTDYLKHDNRRPKPPHVEARPTTTFPPADAIVLYGGSDMSQWQNAKGWTVEGGFLVAGAQAMRTKQAFGSCQIHLEFMVPDAETQKFSNRGNNGIGLMMLYEIQIFDSHPMHKDKLYADGQCAAIYGETPPLVNACRKPGEWQSFDITFTAPVFDGEDLVSPAHVTVYHNGVLVHNHQPFRGPTAWRRIAPYKAHADKLPLGLMSHGSKVKFRNIWIREL